MSFSHSGVIDTVLVTGFRAGFFYACYNYVLRTVYHDLQSLTGTASKHLYEEADEEVELETLPVATSPNHGSSTTASPSESTYNKRALGGSWNFRHPKSSRLCFSLCFSESCTLFVLFLCQEVGVLDPKTRLQNWRTSLFIVIVMILLVIPVMQNILLTYQSPLGHLSRRRSLPTRILLALFPYSLFLFALSMIPLPESLSTEKHGLIAAALSKLVVLGTFIIGLLSGLGAARNSWEFTPILSRSHQRKIPTAEEIRTAEEALERIRNDIVIRRAEENKLRNAKVKGSIKPKDPTYLPIRQKPETSSWLFRVASSITGDSELASIKRELTGLFALEDQMDRNLEDMRSLHANARYSRTVQGRLLQWAGRLFAVYCIFRTFSCILNILTPFRSGPASSNEESSSSYTDLIAHFLTYLVSLLPFVHLDGDQISAIARQVSLGLVGVIILSSVRIVLRTVSRLLKITSQNLGASLLLLILAQLMGTYLISTLVQLRTAFPPKRADDSNVFSTLPAYEVFGAAFDYSYLLSALATTAYLWLDDRINKGGSRLDDA